MAIRSSRSGSFSHQLLIFSTIYNILYPHTGSRYGRLETVGSLAVAAAASSNALRAQAEKLVPPAASTQARFSSGVIRMKSDDENFCD